MNQKGVSLIITFLIMGIALASILGMSSILYGEIRVIRDMGKSVVAFYIGESALESILYSDKKGRMVGQDEITPATRGICSQMNNISGISDSSNRITFLICDGVGDCDFGTSDPIDSSEPTTDCNQCDNCKVIIKSTGFSITGEKTFEAMVNITPFEDNYRLIGGYQGVRRAIELNVVK